MNAQRSAQTLVNSLAYTPHVLSASDHAVMVQMRAMIEPGKGHLRGIEARPIFDEIIGSTVAPEGVTYRHDQVGGLSGWWCEPADAPADKVVLHLHGGWFNWGSAKAFRHLVGHIAREAGIKAFVPDYALAPEHPFPSAVADARTCLDALLGLGMRAVAVTGDSAGGNLALTLVSLASSNPSIVGAVVLSPVTDLTLSGESWESRADADPIFVREQAQSLVAAYLGNTDPADPIASPLFGNLNGLPPIRVHVGNDEVLRDDSVHYVERALAAHVDARLDVWEGMIHGFLGQVGRLEAADHALKAIGAFLAERFATA
jgi:epsilon-lactone hydrolase